MKKAFSIILSLVLALCTVFSLVACNKIDAEGVWESATYLSDKEFGDGAKTVYVEVKVGEQSLVFTVNTDKENLGDALLEHELIAGEDSQYGLMISHVNGMRGDYTLDGAYWALYIGGEYAMTGVSGTVIENGAHYELVYTAA